MWVAMDGTSLKYPKPLALRPKTHQPKIQHYGRTDRSIDMLCKLPQNLARLWMPFAKPSLSVIIREKSLEKFDGMFEA